MEASVKENRLSLLLTPLGGVEYMEVKEMNTLLKIGRERN